MFQISTSPIDEVALKKRLENPKAGAFVSFEGWVRNHHEGREVVLLEYEAFEALAQSEAEKILQEAVSRFEIEEAICVHRTGALCIGALAVWVGVTAAHRGAAFQACQYIMDAIKSRLPIWKKEHYANGDSGWVNCQHCASHSGSDNHHVDKSLGFDEVHYYERQMRLPEVGAEGQATLKQSKVLVVGAGGLGSAALLYLASAGVGTLGICEFDNLEPSNLHRQVLYHASDAGQSKCELAKRRLQALNPFIHIQTYDKKLDLNNIEGILNHYDLVLDCTDNFKTKFLLNDAAVHFQKPLIQASIYQYEGQLQLYLPNGDSPCLRCLWPEMPEADCTGTCEDVGVLGAVPGVFGTLQAMEALKYLLGLPTDLNRHVLMMDLLTSRVQKIRQIQNPACPICGENADRESFLTMMNGNAEEEIDLEIDLAACSREHLNAFQWVDIREAHECLQDDFEALLVQQIPLSRFNLEISTLSPQHAYLVFCQKGIRSKKLVRVLRQQGFTKVYSVQGGVKQIQNWLKAPLQ